MRLVKRASAIHLATIMLGAISPLYCDAQSIVGKSPCNLLLPNTYEPNEYNYPQVIPEGLYAGEYILLAEHFILNWKYKEAAKCISKVKSLAPGSDLERRAVQMEKYRLFNDAMYKKWLLVEKARGSTLKPSTKAYVKASKQFLVEYPNCQYALERLLQEMPPDEERSKIVERLRAIDPTNSYVTDWKNTTNVDFGHFTTKFYSDFKTIFDFGSQISKHNDKSKSGFIDHSGKFVFKIHSPLSSVSMFNEGLSISRESAILNITGKEIAKPNCTRICHFSEGLAPIQVNEYWGFIDNKGKVLIEPQYKNVLGFKDGLAPVQVGDTKKWGFIDKSNQFVIKPQFETALNFSEGLATVNLNRKIGYINKVGKFVIPAKYSAGEPFSNGLAKVINFETPMNRFHEFYIDNKGNKIFDLTALNLKYDPYGERLQHQCSRNLFSNEFVLTGNSTINEPRYAINIDSPLNQTKNCFQNDRLALKLKDLYGYVDRSGKLVIPAKYQDARPFSEGFAAVALDSSQAWSGRSASFSYGFIDTTGKLAFPAKFSKVGDFHEGLAYVEISYGIGGFIDTKGKLVIQFEGESSRFSSGLAPVQYTYKN